MTDKEEKAKGAAEEAALWAEAVRDVRPLPKHGGGHAGAAAGPSSRRASDKAAPARQGGGGLDRRTDEKLRRGRMAIEARLDLHGQSRDKAHEALRRFIRESCRQGRRCVLVITGKGKEGGGVLRVSVPEWLDGVDLRDYILKTYPAKARDGGAGALYVLLRRAR